MGENSVDLKEKLMVAKTSLGILKSICTNKDVDENIVNQLDAMEITMRNLQNLHQLEQFIWTNIERMQMQCDEVRSIMTMLYEAEAAAKQIEDK